MERVKEESKQTMSVHRLEEITIRVVVNPITGKKDFFFTSTPTMDFSPKVGFVVKEIIIDGVKLVIQE